MKAFILLTFLFTFLVSVDRPSLIHAVKYRDQNISGWLMSEKLDGVRGIWNGKKLLTRQGNPLYPNSDFIQNFPPFPLDGELWSRRSDFETIQSIVADTDRSSRWHLLTYNIFEAPDAPGDFYARMQRVREWFDTHPNPFIRIVRQHPIASNKTLQDFLAQVEQQGGEGVMVRNPTTPYLSGRNPNLLKVKSFDDMEGTVIGYTEGKGKYRDMTGALQIELDNGIRFNIGTGLSDNDRKSPPPVGSRITFKYYGFTKNGKPRFASFWRIRR